ncbi:MAG: hypothetical protein ACK48P_00410 [Holosporales bacterium]|jgi:hypothetical protein
MKHFIFRVTRWLACFAVAALFIGGMTGDAFAQTTGTGVDPRTISKNAGIGAGIGKSTFFTDSNTLVNDSYKAGSGVVLGVGGLGAIALGALAMFGRFQWQWLMALIGGLITIAGVGTAIQYLTGVETLKNT